MSILTGDVFKDLLGIFCALAAIVIVYYKWSFTHWKNRGVQHPKPSIPFGNASRLFSKKTTVGEQFGDVYREFKSKCLRYCGVYLFSRPVFIPLDPDLIKSIMSSDFQHFTDHGNYVNEKNDPLSGTLFALKGLKWKNLRAKLTPTFTSGKMKMMFQILVDCSENLLGVVDQIGEEKAALDIKDVVGRFTTDIIGSCAFGIECNSLKDPNSEFRRFGKKVFEFNKIEGLVRFLSVSFPKLLDVFKLTIIPKDVTKFFMGMVEETVEYREKNNVLRKDFMHLLIQLKNNVNISDGDQVGQLKDSTKANLDVGKSLTMNELAAQAFVFFLAGFETSSTTLTFCFYELVSNPPIQVKLRDEINRVLGKHDGKMTYEAIMEMTYMDQVIQETLRKYPPVPVLLRQCTKTYRVPDSELVLEEGARVFIPVLGIHRCSQYYPEPEKFDPERFSPENKAKRHPYTWLPFGEGPRACIGLRFGLMQTKVALAVLLKHYEFNLNSKTETPLTLSPQTGILSVKGGVWLNTHKLCTTK